MAPSPLTSLLTFPSPFPEGPSSLLPPPGTQTLLTDSLACPAAALLVHFARAALIESKDQPTPVIWVGCDGQGLPHWSSVCRRIGLSLQNMMSRDLFTYIDATDVLCRDEEEEEEEEEGGRDDPEDGKVQTMQEPPLAVLYSLLRRALEDIGGREDHTIASARQGQPRALVIVDDITSLAWSLPCPRSQNMVDSAARSTGRWAAAVRTLCTEHSTSLITLQHSGEDALSTHLFTRLFRSSSLWIQVKALSSGMARDCTGQIAIHPIETSEARPEVVTPAKGNAKAVLFITGNDGKTVFWPRGTQITG